MQLQKDVSCSILKPKQTIILINLKHESLAIFNYKLKTVFVNGTWFTMQWNQQYTGNNAGWP